MTTTVSRSAIQVGPTMTADEAAALVQDGNVVCVNGAGSFPCDFVDALTARAPSLTGVSLGHPMRRAGRELALEPVTDELVPHLRHVSDFTYDPHIRAAINRGAASYRPNVPTETTRFFPSDVNFFVSAASPMDKHGYFGLGPFGGWGIDFARIAKNIIVEVNPNQPRIHGDCFVHVSQVKAVIETSYPLAAQSHSSTGGEVESNAQLDGVADNVASLIEHGCTLQFGGGKMPDIVALRLITHGYREIKIHTEAVSDWLVDMVEAGVVDNSGKVGPDQGKTVFAMALGSDRLYQYLDDNPGIAQKPMSQTNDPNVISRNDRQVSVNATLAVDLWGQCASETMGSRHYSGTGGQWEFNRGGYLSRGGKGIVALPSTAAKGTISRITVSLPPGSAVSIGRNDVDYVVTEYGIAHLKGHDHHSRARQLIAIAHPDFREQLTDEARELAFI